jgi:hypothetical protein
MASKATCTQVAQNGQKPLPRFCRFSARWALPKPAGRSENRPVRLSRYRVCLAANAARKSLPPNDLSSTFLQRMVIRFFTFVLLRFERFGEKHIHIPLRRF